MLIDGSFLADCLRSTSSLPLLVIHGSILTVAFVSSLVITLVESIMFLQMEREFHSPRALMGQVTLVGTISEYLPFMLSKRLLNRFGARRLMVFSQCALMVRLYFSTTYHALVHLERFETDSRLWLLGDR